MRALALPVLLFCIAAAPVAALAQTAPVAKPASAPAASGYTVEDTDIGTLLDDPAAKAILFKAIPSFATSDQIDMVRSMTLKGVQQYKPDEITDKVLADIQTEFNKLPAKK